MGGRGGAQIAVRIGKLLLFEQSLSVSSTCPHKSRANRGKTAVLTGDTDDWTVDDRSHNMARTTSSALWQCPLCSKRS